MPWTLSPDSTLRYLLFVCVKSPSKYSTYINIMLITRLTLDIQTRVEHKKWQTFLDLFPTVFFYFYALIIPLAYHNRLYGNHAWSSLRGKRRECVEFLNMWWTRAYVQVWRENEMFGLNRSCVKGGSVVPDTYTHSRKVLGWMSRPLSVQSVCCSRACVGFLQVSRDRLAPPTDANEKKRWKRLIWTIDSCNTDCWNAHLVMQHCAAVMLQVINLNKKAVRLNAFCVKNKQTKNLGFQNGVNTAKHDSICSTSADKVSVSGIDSSAINLLGLSVIFRMPLN